MREKQRTPQEKKSLSYLRDRRNDYGENSKSSRKNIPRSKALGIRAMRHAQNQALRGIVIAASEIDALEAEPRAKQERRRRWSKSRDAPLGKAVARKLWRRKNEP